MKEVREQGSASSLHLPILAWCLNLLSFASRRKVHFHGDRIRLRPHHHRVPNPSVWMDVHEVSSSFQHLRPTSPETSTRCHSSISSSSACSTTSSGSLTPIYSTRPASARRRMRRSKTTRSQEISSACSKRRSEEIKASGGGEEGGGAVFLPLSLHGFKGNLSTHIKACFGE